MSNYPIQITDGVTATSRAILSALDALITKFGQLGNASEEAGKKGKKSGLDIASGLSQVGLLADKVISKFLNLASATGSFFETAFDSGTKSRASFYALTRSVESSNAALKEARILSEDFAEPLDKVTNKLFKFMQAGLDVNDATIFTKALSDLEALGSFNTDQITESISKMLNSGAISDETITELSRAGINSTYIFDRLAVSLGKSSQSLHDLHAQNNLQRIPLTQGSLQAFLDAITNASGAKDKVGSIAKGLADTTIEGFTGRMKARWDNAFADAADGAQSPLKKGLDSLNEEFDHLFSDPGTKAKLGEIMTTIAQQVPIIAEKMPEVVNALVAVDWPKMIKDVSAIVQLFADMVDKVQRLDYVLAPIIGAAAGFVTGGPVGAAIGFGAGLVADWAGHKAADGINSGLNIINENTDRTPSAYTNHEPRPAPSVSVVDGVTYSNSTKLGNQIRSIDPNFREISPVGALEPDPNMSPADNVSWPSSGRDSYDAELDKILKSDSFFSAQEKYYSTHGLSRTASDNNIKPSKNVVINSNISINVSESKEPGKTGDDVLQSLDDSYDSIIDKHANALGAD